MLQATEHQIQSSLFQWIDIQSNLDPRYKNIFAIPNGGNRKLMTGVMMKREGVRAGVPDIMVAWPNGFAPGLFLELKTPKGKVNAAQQDWIARLRRAGYECRVVRSVDESIEVITNYLGPAEQLLDLVSDPF